MTLDEKFELHGPASADDAAAAAFDTLWRQGCDGKDLALAFVRVAAKVVWREEKGNISVIRDLLDKEDLS